MKRSLRMLVCLVVVLTLHSFKKEAAQEQEKERYIQYFNATVNNKPVNIQNSIDNKDRNQFHGSWTEIANGNDIEMYTVKAILPKEILNSDHESKLTFQIYDIKKKEYQISGDHLYLKDFSTHVYLQKNTGLEGGITYTTSSLKKPFKIEITKYEFPNKSITPIVGGKLNGVLYNEKNLMDSIVIHNGDFEVRY